MSNAANPSAAQPRFSRAKQALLKKRLERISKRPPQSFALIRKRSASSPAPLSPAQQRLWFLAQYEPNNAFYNVFQAFWLEGPLNLTALKAGFAEIVRRHRILRSAFAAVEGRPVQAVRACLAPALPLFDLCGLPSQRRQESALRLAQDESARPFDLLRDLPFRLGLLRLAPQRHLLLLNFHHIVFDGVSMEILFRELEELYTAWASGMQHRLPELPVQYADYAEWQHGRLQSGDWRAGLDFWRSRLGGDLPALELPFDRPRPAVQTMRGAYQALCLPAHLKQSLQSLGRRFGATLFMTLLAALQALLMRYSGQRRIIVGIPIDNRDFAEIEDLIGFFVNTLALHSRVEQDAPFAELLEQTRQEFAEASQHRELPFDRVVEELHPQRSLSHHPVYQVMLGYKSSPSPLPRLPGIRACKADVLGNFAKFDLTWIVEDSGGSLETLIEYNTDLFDRSTIRRMAGHLRNLLGQAAQRPEMRLAQLDLLSPAEGRQILEWSRNPAPLSEDSLSRVFEAQAAAAPAAAALVSADGQLTLSYAWLNAAADRGAILLKRLGAGPETCAALCMKRSFRQAVGLLAVVKSGAAYVPLDPQDPAPRLQMMLQDCRAGLLIAEANARLPRFAAKRVDLQAEWAVAGAESPSRLAAGAQAGNLLYVMYTSGSTGRPKGVGVPHRAVTRLTRCADYAQLKPGDRVAQASNAAFDASTFEMWGALLNGAALVEVPHEAVLSPGALRRQIQARAITALFLTTALFNQTAREDPSSFCTLDHMLFGGEAADPDQVRRVLGAVPPRRLLHVYGPTECTTFASWQRVLGVAEGAATVPIGRPISNTEAYVLDRGLELAPAGVAGELYIGGPGLARGYLGKPSQTAGRFVPHHLSSAPGERLYRSGDRFRWHPQGRLQFMGRLDSQVKVRGFRVEPGEIESMLRRHPALSDAAVVAQPDPAGGLRLIACLVASRGRQTADESVRPALQESALRRYLQQRLPAYMVPAFFFLLPELPLTPNGKLDRHALPVPRGGDSAPQPGAAPSTPLQARLAQLWKEVLGVEAVGVQDDFFHLGGHSLLAARLVSRIREELCAGLTLRTLFRSPTIAGLAEEIEAARPQSPAPPLHAVDRDGELPLSFAQQRLWFLDRLQPGNPFYNTPAAWRLHGRLRPGLLEGSLREIQRRHESLRTRFPSSEGRPSQVILRSADIRLALVDLRGLPEARREGEARRCIRLEARRPFDLAQGPVIRAGLIALQPTGCKGLEIEGGILLLTMHHIASDGWSLGILGRELAAIYEAFSMGRPHGLPVLPLQYADYASWQREWMQGEVLQEQLRYWEGRLRGAQALELPVDRPRPSVQAFRGRRHFFEIPPQVSRCVLDLGRRQGATLFMTALAALQTLLHRYSGQSDIVTGTPVASRSRPGTESIIGFFANSLALRNDLGGDPTFLELLGQASETCLQAFAHQEVPFEKLVEHLQPERDLSRSPLFQVMLAVQNVPLADLRLAGISVEALPMDVHTTRFDLELHLRELPEGLRGSLFYDADLFDRTTAQRLQKHFLQLLGNLAANPRQRLSQALFLSRRECFQALAEFNDTARGLPELPLIHQIFQEMALQAPDAGAASFGDCWISYRELGRRADRLSVRLRMEGAGPESVTAVRLPARLEMAAALLGILKAGGAYLPIDLETPQERVEFMLRDSRAAVFLTSRSEAHACPFALPTLFADEDFPAPSSEAARGVPDLPDPLRLAYIIYTSGSTGRPKGVAVPHRAVVRLVCNTDYARLTPEDRVGQISNSSFDAATFEFWGALLNGGRLTGLSRETALAPAELGRQLVQKEVSTLFLTTALFNQVVREAPGAFARVKHLLTGGEAFDPRWGARLLSKAPPRRLLNVYGPTETTTFAGWHHVREVREGMAVPIGRPIANTSLLVLDRCLQPVPPSVAGELLIGGEGLARGYLGRPGLTADRFVPHPWGSRPGERLYRSGDRVRRLADGSIRFLGRLDRQVKVRGFRVEPGEIEAALNEYPSIRQAAVVDVPDPSGGRRLAAYVACDAPGRHLAEELRGYLRERLPAFMMPALFIPLQSLPLTPSGKLDRLALPEAELPPEAAVPEAPPENELERKLADIWQEVLQREKVGVLDNFFDLGGHSLLVTRVHSLLQRSAGIEIPIVELFLHPTIRSLAEFLARQHPQGRAEPHSFDKARQRARRQVQAIRRRRRRRRPGTE